jgi:hypothetical protein
MALIFLLKPVLSLLMALVRIKQLFKISDCYNNFSTKQWSVFFTLQG